MSTGSTWHELLSDSSDIVTVLTFLALLSGWLATFIRSIKLKNRNKKLKDSNANLVQNNKNLRQIIDNIEVLSDVRRILSRVEECVREELKMVNNVTVLNLGLDLESVTPWLNGSLFEISDFEDKQIHYKGLIVNTKNPQIEVLVNGSSNILDQDVNYSIGKIPLIAKKISGRGSIELRFYDYVPVIHGFVVNNQHFFIGFTEVRNGKLQGGVFPYIYCKRNEGGSFNSHICDMFSSWVSYIWDDSKSRAII